jgi:hypothetical protein
MVVVGKVWGRRGVYRFLWGDLSDRIYLEELDKTKLLKLNFKK